MSSHGLATTKDTEPHHHDPKIGERSGKRI
jgi:hypothetical protein